MARTKQTARRTTSSRPTMVDTSGLGPAGSKTEFKRVDEVYDETTGTWIFRDSAPFSGKENEDKYRDYCFVIKKKYDYNSPKFNTFIVIKSITLRDVLSTVIGTIPPVSFQTAQVDIPPQILQTFYPALCEHLETLKKESTEGENVAALQLGLLVDFIQTEYAKELERFSAFLAHDDITFDLLPLLLIPNKEYYMTDSRTGVPRAVILKWATYSCGMSGPFYSLDCEYLESSGVSNKDQVVKQNTKNFGRAKTNLVIWGFQGAVKISSLAAFPMEYHTREEEVRDMLIARGKKWAVHDGVHHVTYTGTAYLSTGRRVYINGRAMIDKSTMRRIKPNWSMTLPNKNNNNDWSNDDDEYYDDSDEANGDVTMKAPNGLTNGRNEQQLTDEDYILATPIVYGFALDDKQWVEFNIDFVSPIVWNDGAFANLILPAEKKQLIQALVEAHSDKGSTGFDDFIVGKGQGLVINLFGPPGIGKTMSAEATSEHLRKPLYVVGAGHLGTYAESLDKSLDEIFDIAHAWNAVVLIDEADVFLEQRSVHDIARNALVAVFLQKLEYFAGILFLTTNRVDTFDDAFQSRIHVALRYRDLDSETREAIWKAFLTKVGATERITPVQWEALVQKQVNGRQIKNAVRTAQALARSKKQDLGFEHINLVLDMMDQFEADMKSLKA